MANEIHVDYASGSTLYAVIRSGAGQVWYPTGQAFEDWGTGSRDADDYDIALTDKSGGRYVGSFDSHVSLGRYTVQVFVQSGGSPADGDTLADGREIVWTGSGEITSLKILGNKAVQDKSTGAVDYYDDDGSTVVLTHTADDGELTIGRTPS